MSVQRIMQQGMEIINNNWHTYIHTYILLVKCTYLFHNVPLWTLPCTYICSGWLHPHSGHVYTGRRSTHWRLGKYILPFQQDDIFQQDDTLLFSILPHIFYCYLLMLLYCYHQEYQCYSAIPTRDCNAYPKETIITFNHSNTVTMFWYILCYGPPLEF